MLSSMLSYHRVYQWARDGATIDKTLFYENREWAIFLICDRNRNDLLE